MNLDVALQKSIREIPECLAAGYVDLSTGMLLSVKTIDSHPREVLDMLAAATADLFQGTNVVTIEKMFKKHRGLKDDGYHYFQEMVIFSDHMIHVYMRGKKNTEHVVCWVTRKSANVGMVITKARMALPGVETAL